MALCLRPQDIWVPFVNSATPRNRITVYIPDATTSVENCQFLLVSESDYKTESLNITESSDAVAIAGAFVLLIAVLGTFRYLVKSVAEVSVNSDEKH